MWLRSCIYTLVFHSILMAGAGDLDITFNGNGKVATDIGGMAQARSVVIQEDGKIVTAGFVLTNTSGDSNISILRYDSNGSLDSSFGNAGTAMGTMGISSEARCVALQSDGKIIAAGQNKILRDGAYIYRIVLVRFDQNGTIDTTFGDNGFVVTESETGTQAAANSIAVYDDDKIAVAGTTVDDFMVVRYTSSGLLDTSFGENGIVTTNVGGSVDMAYGIVLQKDGKLVVSGEGGTCNSRDFIVVRYMDDGSLDTSFGANGIVTTDVGSQDFGGVVSLQKDGKIDVAGRSWDGNIYTISLMQYNADGTLDSTFGAGGIVITKLREYAEANAIAIQSDGKILLTGGSDDGSNTDFALVRYDKNGIPDKTFGENGTGIVYTDMGGVTEFAYGIAIQSDGKIVIAGFIDNMATDWEVGLARYDGSKPLPSSGGSMPAIYYLLQ